MMVKNPTLDVLGRCVREGRLNLGISQSELAMRAGVSLEFLSGLENGTVNPGVSVLMRVTGALRLDLSTLLMEMEAMRRTS